MRSYHFIHDDYEVFDVVTDGASIPTLFILPCDTHVVYIDREYYDADMWIGLQTKTKVHAQLRRDIRRCLFSTDYRNKTVVNVSSIPDRLARFCTQAVMALPIEILSRTGCLVAECESQERMRVRVLDDSARIKKKLRIAISGQWFLVETWISVYLSNQFVVFVYKVAPTALSVVEF